MKIKDIIIGVSLIALSILIGLLIGQMQGAYWVRIIPILLDTLIVYFGMCYTISGFMGE